LAETRLVSTCDLGDEILRELKVTLRAGQSDMAEIGREEQELGSQIDVLLTPQREPQHAQEWRKS